MQIASSYLQILLNEELLKVATEQLIITHQQVEKNQKLVEVGNMSRGELYEIQAQEAVEKANVTKAQNTLSISYLTLMQHMDLENFKPILPINGYIVLRGRRRRGFARKPRFCKYSYKLLNRRKSGTDAATNKAVL